MLATAPQTTEKTLSTYVAQGLHIMDSLPVADTSLFSGKLGHMLLYAYAYKLTGQEDCWQKSMTCLDEVLTRIQQPAHSTLINVPGAIPSLCYLVQILNEDDIADIDLGAAMLLQLDQVVFDTALAQLEEQNIDFLYGATGALNYLSARIGHSPEAEGHLRRLFQALLQQKVEDERGARFYNSHINRQNESTDMNLGLAHGQCGLLLVLLKIYEAGLLQQEIKTLVGAMLQYLLDLQLPPEPESGYVSFFPARTQEELAATDPKNRVKYNNRMGWCYGDLNVVLVLYKAARLLQLPHLVAIADEVGLQTCSRRTFKESGIENAHICHGSSSLVMCYNALYHEMPRPDYLEAKNYWLQRTTDYLDHEFQHYQENKHASGFLMGIPGILTVLITELLDTPTSWERLLLF